MANVIDVHVHFGAPGDVDGNPVHGCYWSDRFEHSPAFWAFRFITGTLFGRMTYGRARKKVFRLVRKSEHVRKIVLLALDKVYDSQGGARLDLTNLFVDNETIVKLAAQNSRILFGASVHPYRKLWPDALDYCLRNKAVLCKWLPSAMGIDPSDPKCGPFYDKLAAHKLPLLCHVGTEKSIPACDDSFKPFNNARYLRGALAKGVPVIFAHCSLPFEPEDLASDAAFQDFLSVMADAETHGWSAYSDISALLLFRATYIPYLLDHIPANRFILGSDWPIPMISFGPRTMPNICDRIAHLVDAIFTKNLLDKNFTDLEDFGFPPGAFTAAEDLFSRIVYP